MLALLLDFGASANAYVDRKEFSRREYQSVRRLLNEEGMGPLTTEYFTRLRTLERGRPSMGDIPAHARSYREAVVRLSLAACATATSCTPTIEDGILATSGDSDLNILYRIVMQCQILDDIIDYQKDLLIGLPGFLTGGRSLWQSLDLTGEASTGYANVCNSSVTMRTSPFRVALSLVTTLTRLALKLRRWCPDSFAKTVTEAPCQESFLFNRSDKNR